MKNTHLSLEDRKKIQEGLENQLSRTEIARNINKDISTNLQNRDVIIIEDIVDSGISLNFLTDYIFKKYRPKSIVSVSLISRISKRKVSVKIDYLGKEIDEDSFLVGYGLDYKKMFRNERYVFVPSQEEIEEWDKLVKE